MLDLPRLRRIRLSAKPAAQRAVALGLLMPNYNLPPRTRVVVEGLERLPPPPVIFAMNHTDRYNYWPFQYRLWRATGRFTATWVKGKYYENELVGRFMELTNNIPTVSRGYLIARDFLSTMGRAPDETEYGALRRRVDVAAGVVDGDAPTRASLGPAIAPLFETPRDMLGRPFDPSRETWEEAVAALFRTMMARFVEINAEALALGLDLLVFPQGTRSKRLSRGHVGLAQVALKFARTVVPVGCNGSDAVYPGSSPLAKGGNIVYRVGEPLTYEAMARWHVPDFEPFTAAAEREHREPFQGLVDEVMERIDRLLDEPYRFAEDRRSDGVEGARRFL